MMTHPNHQLDKVEWLDHFGIYSGYYKHFSIVQWSVHNCLDTFNCNFCTEEIIAAYLQQTYVAPGIVTFNDNCKPLKIQRLIWLECFNIFYR